MDDKVNKPEEVIGIKFPVKDLQLYKDWLKHFEKYPFLEDKSPFLD